MKKHVESFLTTVVIWMKVLRSLHFKTSLFPFLPSFLPSLPPPSHSFSLSHFSSLPSQELRGLTGCYLPKKWFFWLHKHSEFNYLTSFQSFFICKSHTILGDTYCLLFLGFDDPSALLKHELAYCLGQMQVYLICALEFNNNNYYLHCILIIIDCY